MECAARATVSIPAVWSISPDNIGRFGNALSASVGPGTQAVFLFGQDIALGQSTKFHFAPQISRESPIAMATAPNMEFDTDGFVTNFSSER